MRQRWAQLWGGPEDGASVWMAPGDLPARVGVHRLPDGGLVPIRGRALLLEDSPQYPHLQVYEHLTLDTLRLWRAAAGQRGRLFDPAGYQQLEDVPLYLWRELVTRWAAL
jgi:hypothetical protein